MRTLYCTSAGVDRIAGKVSFSNYQLSRAKKKDKLVFQEHDAQPSSIGYYVFSHWRKRTIIPMIQNRDPGWAPATTTFRLERVWCSIREVNTAAHF